MSKFHHVFSEHNVLLQSWLCANHLCRHSMTPSTHSILGTSIHTDLQKLHAELGAEFSYGKSERLLQLMSSNKRHINNRKRLRRTIKNVGQCIENYEIAADTTTDNTSEFFIHVDVAICIIGKKKEKTSKF